MTLAVYRRMYEIRSYLFPIAYSLLPFAFCLLPYLNRPSLQLHRDQHHGDDGDGKP